MIKALLFFFLMVAHSNMCIAMLFGIVDTVPKSTLENHPVYPPDTADIEKIKRSVEPLIHMSIPEIIAEVPTASGIFFVGCPNCNGGAQEMNVLSWKPGMGETVRCNYCNMLFPNEKFPNNREKVIFAPSGTKQVYRYYEGADGRQYFYEAHAWYERWQWIRTMAGQLAKVWYITRDNAYGDRAAAITGRFAQLFPDYAIRYDYPNAPVKFFPADQKWPFEGLQPYRGAKWRWWGYNDIPTELANVYDILSAGYDWKRMDAVSGPGTKKRIERDLLRLGYEVTTANPEVYSNMSPGMYRDMIRLGRILGDHGMVDEAVKRFREFFSRGFFADGWWKEGTTSYHDMTIGGLKTVVDALTGYMDSIAQEMPVYQKALDISKTAVLPNGRKIPINDTWWFRKGNETDHTVSRLWPSLGNAALGTGQGENQVMLNVNWSGNYGHSHYDNGAIILYALGSELLSDIGYTHTKYRGWTVHTASHNTVVIDQKNQDVGSMEKPVTGHLRFYDDSDEHIKAIDVDASPAYLTVKTYRRRLIMVHVAPGYDYVVDRFDVEGGKDHDWFLHGMCEEEGTLQTSIVLDKPVETLVPDWGGKDKPTSQYDADLAGKRIHAYSYIRDIRSGMATTPWTATWKYKQSGLRTHVLSPKATTVFRFRSPSVRPAEEDDTKLDDFQHTGIMQRHSSGKSTFLAVHEPFRKNPWIESVQMEGDALVIRYQLNGTEVNDRISLSNGDIEVASSAGWEYRSGRARTGTVKTLEKEDGTWRLLLDREAPKVNYVRLDLSGGGTRYYPVAAAHGKWLELSEDPGFTMGSDGEIKFHTFPNDEYKGPLGYTLFSSSNGK